MTEPLAIGDMVVLTRVHEGSDAYQSGLRVGAIGTITGVAVCYPGHDWAVQFRGHSRLVETLSGSLRRIPPPEVGSWDECVWKPGVKAPREVA